MLVSILNTYAVEVPNTNNTIETHTNEQYGFSYSKTADSSGRIIRTYKKDTEAPVLLGAVQVSLNQNSGKGNYGQTKVLLSDLGMNDSSIEALSAETLDIYATAKSIQSIVTYTKTDINGNTQIINEGIALEEVSTLAADPNLPVDFGNGDGSYDSYFHKYSDEYMVITMLITEMGDGYFYYTAEATWLTMPLFRFTDAFGICVMQHAIEPSTRRGWVSYTEYFRQDTGLFTYYYDSETIRETISNYHDCTSGNWIGSAIKFNLPDDDYDIDIDPNNGSLIEKPPLLYYKNFTVHYEFKASVINPELITRFNVTATYDHRKIAIQLNAGVEISTSGSSASIGLSIAGDSDKRTLEFPQMIVYTPND